MEPNRPTTLPPLPAKPTSTTEPVPVGKPTKQRAQKGDKAERHLLDAERSLALFKAARITKQGATEADKNACRGKLQVIFPFFEKIIEDHPITKEGNNAALFSRVLNLRLKVKSTKGGTNL